MAMPSVAVATAELRAAEAGEERARLEGDADRSRSPVPGHHFHGPLFGHSTDLCRHRQLHRGSTFFFNNPIYTFRQLPDDLEQLPAHVNTTVKLATLASIVDLVFGYPFAYILIRRVRYRELVRTVDDVSALRSALPCLRDHYILLPEVRSSAW